MLLNINHTKLYHKDLLETFDYSKLPESKVANKEVRNLFKELTNSAIYFKALQESRIDTELLNFNYLSKEIILTAKTIPGEIYSTSQIN
jgi:hypothetical protein